MVQIKNTEAVKLATKIPFFAGLIPSQLRALLSDGHVVAYQAGDILCEEGSPSAKLFIVLSGEAAVMKEDVELARVGPVDVIGEMGVVTDQPRCATVQAVCASAFLEITKAKFDVAISSDPELAACLYRNLLHSSFGKLKMMNEHLAGCGAHDGSFGAIL